MVMQWSPLFVTMAVLFLVVSVACGGESTADPSPTATFAPGTTPSPTVTPAAVVERTRRCLAEAIGERAAREVSTGQRPPTSEERDAFNGCVNMRPQLDFDLLPEASAPAGLGTVAWPNKFQESSALFGRLPSEIAGHRIRARFEQEYKRGGFSTTYEDDPEIGVHVLDLAKGDFFGPDTKTGQYVAYLAQLPQWEVVAAGREGDLAWVQFKDDGHGMIWGNAPGSIVFQAMANDLSVLMALVEAMVSAANG